MDREEEKKGKKSVAIIPFQDLSSYEKWFTFRTGNERILFQMRKRDRHRTDKKECIMMIEENYVMHDGR